jgi:hypothetical protein
MTSAFTPLRWSQLTCGMQPTRPAASDDDGDIDSRRVVLIRPLRSADDASGGAWFLLLLAASGAVQWFNGPPVRELRHPALIRLTTKQTCYA